MNSDVFKGVFAWLFSIAVQVVLFKRIDLSFGEFDFIHFIVYPLFIMVLPFRTPRFLVILIGFISGLTIDMFYDSPGIHASAATLMAFLRPYLLRAIEPYEGYKMDKTPNLGTMGLPWFLSYSSILLGIYLLFYFSVEAFSFIYYFDIIMRSIFSFVASFVVIVIYQIIQSARS